MGKSDMKLMRNCSFLVMCLVIGALSILSGCGNNQAAIKPDTFGERPPLDSETPVDKEKVTVVTE